MTENPERRQSSRKRPEQLVYVELERDNGGMMLNVSEEGFSFRAVGPVRKDEKIHFAFAIDGTRQLEGHGELEWMEEGGKVGGLRFTEVSQEFHGEIRRWLREPDAPMDRGKKSVPAVATPVDTLAKNLWNVKVESRKSLPSAPEVEKPEIARETIPAMENPAMKIPREETKTVGSPEQALLKVGEKSMAAPVTQEERDAPSLSAMNIRREEKKITISPETVPAEIVRTEPEKTELPVEIALFPALEQVEERKVLGEPRTREQEERIQQLEGLVGAQEIFSARLNRAAAPGIVVIGLTMLLVAIVFSFRHDIGESLIWVGQKMSGESRQAGAETREPRTNVSGISPNESLVADTPPKRAGVRVPPVQAKPKASGSNSNVAAPATAPVAAEEKPGQAELAVAERILGSKNGSRDITGAVKLLWAAVQKGNSAALLSLCELYIRGEVIRKNCDQARVLLTAAAKKGDAGAKAKLQQLDKEGCP